MIQIRKNTFETNSSSTHSLVISKTPVKKEDFPHFLNLRGDEDYGWGPEVLTTTGEKADYLYTAIIDCDLIAQRNKYIKILRRWGIEVGVLSIHCTGSVDHAGELVPFIDEVLSDDEHDYDKLKRFLFNGNSVIYLGNDNDGDGDDTSWIAAKDYEGADKDTEHYEYYFKGN